MLYREAADDAAWIALSRLLTAREPMDMVLCLHPGEAAFPKPFQPANDPGRLERVTTYEDDDVPHCSSRISVTTDAIALLQDRVEPFEEWGDSLALYRPHWNEWVAAYIPHEAMMLVADDSLAQAVNGAGMQFVETPPDWW